MSGETMIKEEVLLTSNCESRPFAMDIRCRDHGSEKLPLVMFIHGFKGFKDFGPFNMMADLFADYGFVFAKPSLSHCGTTLENPHRIVDLEAFSRDNMSVQMDDLQVAIETLFDPQKNPLYDRCDFDRFYLIGHSRGGSEALITAAEHPELVKGVATWAAVANFEELWTAVSLFLWRMRGTFWEWDQWNDEYLPVSYGIAEDYYDNYERLDILKAVGKLQIPLFVAHPLDDVVVPATHALEITERHHHHHESLLLHDGGHIFGMKNPHRDARLPPPLKKIVERTANFFHRM